MTCQSRGVVSSVRAGSLETTVQEGHNEALTKKADGEMGVGGRVESYLSTKEWGMRMGELGFVCDGHVHSAIFKVDKQQEPTVQQRELCSMYEVAWTGGKFGGEWIHVYLWLNPYAVYLQLSQHCYKPYPNTMVSLCQGVMVVRDIDHVGD